MKAVSNTSPLIFLTKVGRLNFLDSHDILIPAQVFGELEKWEKVDSDSYLTLNRWIKNKKITPTKADALRDLPKGLGEGEKAAISLALKESIKMIFIDEKKARITAKSLGLIPKGTIAIIYQQFLEKNITKQECRKLVFELVKKGYRIREELIAEFLGKLE